jgi:hypothetical protein
MSSKKKSLSSMNGRVVSTRTAHVVSRCPLGTGDLLLSGSGGLTTNSFGGFPVSGSTAWQPRPINLGWVADLASHFAYFKLNRITLKYAPRFRPVVDAALSTAGVISVGFADDPARATSGTPAVVQELRSAGEFSLDRAFSLDYVPTGPQGRWLFSSEVVAPGTTADRICSPGIFIGAMSSVATATFYGVTVGRLELIFDISFKGAVAYVIPTEMSPDRPESKTETKSTTSSAGASASVKDLIAKKEALKEQDYELVDLSQFRGVRLRKEV